MLKITDKQRQLLIWLRLNKGSVSYLSALHSGRTLGSCIKNGWVTKDMSNGYQISLTDAGRNVLT